MARVCTVCPHPNRRQVEEALLLGEPYRAIAGRFGLSRSSLTRHVERHVGPRIERAARAQEQMGAANLWRRLLEIETRARRISEAAEEAKDFRAATGALREMARVVELLGRLRGDLEPEEEKAKRVSNYILVFEGGAPKVLPAPIETTAKELPEGPEGAPEDERGEGE